MSSLKRWHAPQLLQREALKVILRLMTPESIEELKNAFVAMDRKGTGFITIAELKQALTDSGLRLAVEEIERVLSSFDYSADGRINYSEFLLATLDKKQVLDEAALHTAFKFFDVDNSGHISVEDITNALVRTGVTVSNDELTSVMQKWGRGAAITYEGFKKMMGAIEQEASPLRLAEDGSLVSSFFLSPRTFSQPRSGGVLEVVIDTS
jgi:calcium-dependent protein kinase